MSESTDERERKIAELEAQLQALRMAAATPPPAAQQGIETGDAGSIVNPMQISAGGDVRDNLVLRDITIAEGGVLIVGPPPAALPPTPAAPQPALGDGRRQVGG